MSHERIRTNRTQTGAVNTYGPDADTKARRGSVLDPVFQFEKPEYASIDEAVAAAKRRSILNDVAGWRNTSSDVLRSNPQIGGGIDAAVGTPSPLAMGRKVSPAELSLLRQAASRHGIDAGILRALAQVENGPTVQGLEGPTKGLGVVSVPAPTFGEQADVAGRTTSNTLTKYRRALGKEPMDQGKYTEDFLRYFSRGGPGYPGYAPLGARNDPTNLNENHLRRLLEHYQPDTGIRSLNDLSPFILGPRQ